MNGTLPWLLLAIGVLAASDANQESTDAVIRANNQFSSELYDVIRKWSKEDNIIVSPISVTTVLAMLDAGARGSTRDTIRSTLHLFTSDDQFNYGYRTLLSQLRSDDHVTLEIVNKIYPIECYKLNASFTDTLRTYYSAELQHLNYLKNVEAASVINNFVTNAIYFKGLWKHPFLKHTRKMDFFANGAESAIKVDMMTLKKDILYADIQELDAHVILLPYKGDRFSLMILLPNKRNGMAETEEKLKSFPLNNIIDRLEYERVILYLPRFKLESTIDLQTPLTNLGLEEIFNPANANLSGIPAEELKEKLFVSKAFQKAFIEVNEEGSEAAAATVMLGGGGGGDDDGPPIIPIIFRVDHPFMSFIVARGTPAEYKLQQSVLFYSRVNKV